MTVDNRPGDRLPPPPGVDALDDRDLVGPVPDPAGDRADQPDSSEVDETGESAARQSDGQVGAGRAPDVVAVSVAGAARGLGVAPGTLRSWERRYGLGPSGHTSGGHRRYGPVDLARLGVMHRLVQEGVPPAEAARAAIQAPIQPEDVDAANPYSAFISPSRSPGEAEELDEVGQGSDHAHTTSSSSGGGRVLSVPSHPRVVRGLARSAMALDSAACRRAISGALTHQGVVATWDELVRPVMAAIGDRWEQTNRGVEIEHSFSAVLSGALAGHAARLERPHNGRPALLAGAPEDLHDLPLLVLQAALAEVGIRSHVLGARTPWEALADAVVRIGPPVVFLWAQLPGARAPRLPTVRPTPTLVLGGPGWDAMATDAQRVDDLASAVGAVRLAMGL